MWNKTVHAKNMEYSKKWKYKSLLLQKYLYNKKFPDPR